MEPVPYCGEQIRRWSVGPSTFLAYPERGARLMHWLVEHGDGTLREVIYWPPDLTSVADIAKVRGGNPILFPFAARTFDQGEINRWRAPNGTSLPMPMHGFVRQGQCRVVSLGERGFTAQYVPDDAARAAYPFDYEFEVTYRFEPLGLSCELVLRNLGTVPIPWCPGHHFYFAVPWTEGHTRADYSLHIPAAKTLRQDATGKLVSGPSFPSEVTLDQPELIDTYHASLRGAEAVFGPRGAPGSVAVRLGTDEVPDPNAVFVTWSTGPDAPHYCVEPWMGPANAPEHKAGLQWVAPGRAESFVVEVEVR